MGNRLHLTGRIGKLNNEKRGLLTIHYNDGAKQTLEYERSGEKEEYQQRIDQIIKEAFDAIISSWKKMTAY